MAFRWVVHSVCTSVFGHPKNEYEYAKNEYGSTTMMCTRGGVSCKSMKDPNEEGHCPTMFQMPLHYPRYNKVDYEKMEECRLDMLLKQYGLSYEGTLDEKRSFAMGAFLWPDQI